MSTREAIKQRHVDTNLVAFHENLGVCFGRKKQDVKNEFESITQAPERHM